MTLEGNGERGGAEEVKGGRRGRREKEKEEGGWVQTSSFWTEEEGGWSSFCSLVDDETKVKFAKSAIFWPPLANKKLCGCVCGRWVDGVCELWENRVGETKVDKARVGGRDTTKAKQRHPSPERERERETESRERRKNSMPYLVVGHIFPRRSALSFDNSCVGPWGRGPWPCVTVHGGLRSPGG